VAALAELYTLLRQHFGALTGPGARRPWWPLYSDDQPFEILVGAVLVQQTRWETVEAATLRLIAADLLSPQALAAADPLELAALIRPSAFHTQKAPGLIAIARHICLRHGSAAAMLAQPTAPLRAELLGQPTVGPETCDVTMRYGGGHPVFVVDEYTRRLLERVGVWSANGAEAAAAKYAKPWSANGAEAAAAKYAKPWSANGAEAAAAKYAKAKGRKGEGRGREMGAGEGGAAVSFWRRASYEAVRLTIEAELSGVARGTIGAKLTPAPPHLPFRGPHSAAPAPQAPPAHVPSPSPRSTPTTTRRSTRCASATVWCGRAATGRPRAASTAGRRGARATSTATTAARSGRSARTTAAGRQTRSAERGRARLRQSANLSSRAAAPGSRRPPSLRRHQ
jgi:endonuclease III-like uncharacterized protein